MPWFPSGLESAAGWRITLLGVIPWLGAAPMSRHLEPMVSSIFCLLPRIVPGPQFLSTPFKSLHPQQYWCPIDYDEAPRMRARISEVCGLQSRQDTIHIISDFMKSETSLIPLSLNVWAIEYNIKRAVPYLPHKQSAFATTSSGPLRVLWETTRLVSTTDLLTLFSFFITLSLIALAVVRKDGTAVLALVLISLHSSKCSYSLWSRIKSRLLVDYLGDQSRLPVDYSGDQYRRTVIIQTKETAFWILVCDRLAFQTLFNGLERLELTERYLPSETGLLDIASDPILSLSFIFFANSRFTNQLAIAVAYILLTLLFGVVAPPYICPGEFKATELFPPGVTDTHLPKPDLRSSEVNPSLARTLWYAIRVLRSTKWVRSIDAVPKDAGWDAWLQEAAVNIDNDDWPAQAEKTRLVDGDNNVYAETAAEPHEECREPSLEIGPVHESQW